VGRGADRKNRSDLALAKFAEADKYAPNWGRLHLKWGEALLWSGDGPGAARDLCTGKARSDRSAGFGAKFSICARGGHATQVFQILALSLESE
jgi:hypothetical protein